MKCPYCNYNKKFKIGDLVIPTEKYIQWELDNPDYSVDNDQHYMAWLYAAMFQEDFIGKIIKFNKYEDCVWVSFIVDPTINDELYIEFSSLKKIKMKCLKCGCNKKPIEKMGCFICKKCRTIIEYK